MNKLMGWVSRNRKMIAVGVGAVAAALGGDYVGALTMVAQVVGLGV